MKKIELLSPAGNMDSLKAAIEAGCDAVYLGGRLFGARSFAGNFTNEEIINAINYAHLYGVRVYVTINTIIYEREVENFIDYVGFLHKNNVDAVIIQDLGMLDLVGKTFPNLEIHASTQMHVHNFEGALFAKQMGVKRVVMARETPLSVIEKIKKELDIEVEVFVHGALCVSYSGQCLMSALIGKRSGNRGSCAQVCRKAYDLYDIDEKKLNQERYLLSTKDLYTLNNLDKLLKIGVDSFKIEGRMKRPQYVYLVTKIYRKAIDNYVKTGNLNINDEDVLELKKIFNRNFTKGFMLGEENDKFVYQKRPNHQGVKVGEVVKYCHENLFIKLFGDVNINDGLRIEDDKEDKGLVINEMFVNQNKVKQAKKGSVIMIKYDKFVSAGKDVLLTTCSSQIKRINEVLKRPKRKVLIDVYISIKKNEKVLIKVDDGKNSVSLKSDFIAERAANNPLKKETIVNQIKKTGSTIYEVKDVHLNLDKNVFVNIKNLNELRREILLKLDEKRLYKTLFCKEKYNIIVPDFQRKENKSVLLDNVYDYKNNLHNDIIYTNNKDLLKYDNVVYRLPRILNDYPSINKRVLISDVGGIVKYDDFDTDFSFNVVNSYTLALLHKLGAKKVTLSYELNVSQIKLMLDNYVKRYKKHPNCEVIVDSYPEVMISRFDLNKMYNVKKSYLKDEFGNTYTIKSNDDFMTIYNYKKITYDKKEELYKIGVNYLRTNIDHVK